MNRKGQALVEFILILPIIVFMLLLVIDMGRLMIMKNHLETVLSSVNKDTTVINDKEYDIKIEKKDNYIIVKSCVDVVTPGLSRILGDPACLETSKNMEE